MASTAHEVFQCLRPLLGPLPGLRGIEIGASTYGPCVRLITNSAFAPNPQTEQLINDNAVQLINAHYTPANDTLTTTVSEPVRVQRHDPLQPGISIGCFECGTLGMFVQDLYTNAPGFITCYHVVGGWQGIGVTQPGPGTDGGNFSSDVVGTLERFVPYTSGFDAAFVRLNGTRKLDHNLFGTALCLQSVGELAVGDLVSKSGRTTGLTHGKVVGKGAFLVDYRFYGTQVISGYSIAPVIDGAQLSTVGDSGAIWHSDAGVAKGLHFATDKTTGFALASSLLELFPLLHIKLL